MTIAKLSLHSPFSNSRMGTADPTWRICSTMVCLWRVVRNGCSSAASKANPAFRSKNPLVTECICTVFSIGHRPGFVSYVVVRGAFWKGEKTFGIFHRQRKTAAFNKWKKLFGMFIISSIHSPIFFFFYVCLSLYLSVRLLVYLLISQPFCQSDWLAFSQYASMYLFITVFILTDEIFWYIFKVRLLFFSVIIVRRKLCLIVPLTVYDR